MTPTNRSKQAGFTLVEMVTYLALFTLMTSLIMTTERFAHMQTSFEAAHTRAVFEWERFERQLRQDVTQATSMVVSPDAQMLTITRKQPGDRPPIEVSYRYVEEEGFEQPVFRRFTAEQLPILLSDHLDGVEFDLHADGLTLEMRGRLTYRRSSTEVSYTRELHAWFRSRLEGGE